MKTQSLRWLPLILLALITACAGTDRKRSVGTVLDDQTAEVTAFLCARMLEAGALDVFVTPVVMKKGRPGALVTALARPDTAPALERLLLDESTTLGVRRRREERRVLSREVRAVVTPFGEVRVKLAARPSRTTAAPCWKRRPASPACIRAATRASCACGPPRPTSSGWTMSSPPWRPSFRR